MEKCKICPINSGETCNNFAIWNMVMFPYCETEGHTICPECKGRITWFKFTGKKFHGEVIGQKEGNCSCGNWYWTTMMGIEPITKEIE
jgi:hypothetical protein